MECTPMPNAHVPRLAKIADENDNPELARDVGVLHWIGPVSENHESSGCKQSR